MRVLLYIVAPSQKSLSQWKHKHALCFPILFHKQHDFQKYIFQHKICVLIPLQLLLKNFSFENEFRELLL